MKRLSLYFSLLLTLFFATILSGCRDDLLYVDSEIGEGSRDIDFTIQYLPMRAVDLSTRALTPGNTINEVKNITIAVYDREGNLFKFYRPGDEDVEQLSAGDVSVEMTNNVGGEQKDKVKQIKLRIKNFPYGKYQIFAVGNLDINESNASTVADLQKIQTTWNPENIAANDALYGYFDEGNIEDSDDFNRPFGFGPQTLIINRNTTELHSWMRRQASKVTVGFDPSGLKPDVLIYIKSVTIKDIPKKCYLGQDNTPTDTLSQLISKGQTIYYTKQGPAASTSPDYKGWLVMGRGSTNLDRWHNDDSPSLFFFENMQGDYSNVSPESERKKYDKRQDPAVMGNITHSGQPDYKDDVECGTYIEVQAYYNSTNLENCTNGMITYRFMLGQDEKYNYNAQRNHHYKVTLGFKGWANQPDWHINYVEEDPDIIAADEFQVSYLYNKKAVMPVKINGNCTKLTARIIQNCWYPCDTVRATMIHDGVLDSVPMNPYGSFKWNVEAAKKFNGYNASYLGFLALQAPIVGSSGEIATDVIKNVSFSQAGMDALSDYYFGNSQNYREYEVVPNNYPGTGNLNLNGYEVRNAAAENPYEPCVESGAASRIFWIPMLTRNKTMINDSGFTGTNPYDSFQRKAVVRLTATFNIRGKELTRTRDVTIYQVRRIVNPKAVWHDDTNTEPFEVKLCQQLDPDDTDYTQFESEGEWSATVTAMYGGDFLSLTGGNLPNTDKHSVSGMTKTPIEFKINFDSRNTSTTPRCAIIRVLYHGNQCEHLIFVRQGYRRALAVIDGGDEWSSWCLVGADVANNTSNNKYYPAEITMSPLQIGSLFKMRNYRQAILIGNNGEYGHEGIFGPGQPVNNHPFKIYSQGMGGAGLTWENIKSNSGVMNTKFPNTDKGSTAWNNMNHPWVNFYYDNVDANERHYYSIPTLAQFEALRSSTAPTDFACGICYSDGATTTELNIDRSQSFQDHGNDNNGGKGSASGVRACIVYNHYDGRQIIFPLGANGMGRRTQFNLQDGFNTTWKGMLRYADVQNPLTNASNPGNIYRPIVYDLPSVAGAIYWLRAPVSDGHVDNSGKSSSFGWDFNYFSMAYSPYTANNLNDACPIKMIHVGWEPINGRDGKQPVNFTAPKKRQAVKKQVKKRVK
ncbi:MAG: hypothetical protein NC097_04925 [Clostridium sp.]|nr:hypothetical protein [Prevotella sp.]MCM1429120.1 hypothetical protein [Clostridium sp.]